MLSQQVANLLSQQVARTTQRPAGCEHAESACFKSTESACYESAESAPTPPHHAHYLLPEGPVVRGGGEDLHGPVPQHRVRGHGRLDLREDALEGVQGDRLPVKLALRQALIVLSQHAVPVHVVGGAVLQGGRGELLYSGNSRTKDSRILRGV